MSDVILQEHDLQRLRDMCGGVIPESVEKAYVDYERCWTRAGRQGQMSVEMLTMIVMDGNGLPKHEVPDSGWGKVSVGTEVEVVNLFQTGHVKYTGTFQGLAAGMMAGQLIIWPFGDEGDRRFLEPKQVRLRKGLSPEVSAPVSDQEIVFEEPEVETPKRRTVVLDEVKDDGTDKMVVPEEEEPPQRLGPARSIMQSGVGDQVKVLWNSQILDVVIQKLPDEDHRGKIKARGVEHAENSPGRWYPVEDFTVPRLSLDELHVNTDAPKVREPELAGV